MNKKILTASLLSFSILLAGCGGDEKKDDSAGQELQTNEQNNNNELGVGIDYGSHNFYKAYSGNLDHIHGLGFAGNKNALFFAAHDGLKVYQNGKWFKTKEMNNDYMGFNAVDQGFYTSGHPGKGVNLPNPLGLKRSFDDGQTLEDLGFEGESDFHAMGVGYVNHIIYVLNGHRNSKMDQGLYVSKDNGANWTNVKAQGLGAKVFSIAVHPTNGQMVAVAGQEGIFLSQDGGESFNLITSNRQGTSTFFTEDALWYGAYGQKPTLMKYSLKEETKTEINLPKLEGDAVMYFAVNPKEKSELVFASFKGSVYLSHDKGDNWEQIVKEGDIK